MIELQCDTIETTIGRMVVVCDGMLLCAADYEGYEARMHALLRKHYGDVHLTPRDDPNGVSTQLRAYFAGRTAAIAAIPIAPVGTAFQQLVWSALREILAGSTMTYGALAIRLGRPNAARAVGYANALNPIAIVVPCHRLVGANGDLTGYAGGLHRKEWLLAHERAHQHDNMRGANVNASAGANL